MIMKYNITADQVIPEALIGYILTQKTTKLNFLPFVLKELRVQRF